MSRFIIGLTLLAAEGCGDGAGDVASPRAADSCRLEGKSSRVTALQPIRDGAIALTEDGSLWCWGDDLTGMCGGWFFERAQQMKPSCITSLNIDGMVAALHADGSASFWGPNSGSLGEGVIVTSSMDEVGDVRQLVSGGPFVAALNEAGEVWIWGDLPVRAGESKPFEAWQRLPFAPDVARIAASGSLCAIHEDGRVECMGRNFEGELAVDRETLEVPAELPLVGVVDISIDFSLVCAVLTDGSVRCSGRNVFGTLAVATDEVRQRTGFETVQGLPPVDRVKISAGGHTVCADAAGTLWCWGSNAFGMFADKDETQSPDIRLPTKVEAFEDVRDFALTSGALCVLREDESVWCRGFSENLGRCEHFGQGWGEVKFGPCDG